MELQIIQSKIYEIRGMRVLLDFDLAEMYQVETKNLKRAVRRNIERFPEDFMFELTDSENEDLRCNFGTSSWGGSRYPPFAFTEGTEKGTFSVPSVFVFRGSNFWFIPIMHQYSILGNIIVLVILNFQIENFD